MFIGIVLAGALGGLIGYAVVRASCADSPTHAERMLTQVPGFHAHVSSCTWTLLIAAVVGTVLSAIGAGIVAILVMRAQSEWRAHSPTTR
jgi:uncharacterized membrane-anchored protein YitT (DUF2179 family)